MKAIRILAIAALGSALVTSAASARGLLGENMVAFQVGHTDTSVPGATIQTMSYALGANFNYFNDGQFGSDFYVSGAYGHDLESGFSAKLYSVNIGNNVYYNFSDTIRPFVGGALGLQHVDTSNGHSDDFTWAVQAGVEWSFLYNWSVTPAIAYGKIFDSNANGETSYSIALNYWVNHNLNVGGFAAHNDGNGYYSNTFGVSLGWAY